MVHPYDSAAADFTSVFCAANPGSCMCPPNAACAGEVLDFCTTHLFLDPVAQTEFIYYVYDSPVAVDYPLNAFDMPDNQPPYGCPVDLYTLEVDQSGSGFQDSTLLPGVTLDATTPKVSVSLSDGSLASETWTYRLIYNGWKYEEFQPKLCYMQIPASFMVAPIPSYQLDESQLTPTIYTMESYEYTGGPGCSGVTYNLQGLDAAFMIWDDGSTNPTLEVDQYNSGVTTQQSFALTFEVLDDSGYVLVSEPFTLDISACLTASVNTLSFDPLGPIIDENGDQELDYDITVPSAAGAKPYQMTVQPVNHNTAVCGDLTITVEALSDPDFPNYASFDATTGVIDFNFDNRASTDQDQTLELTIKAENDAGASIIEVVILNTHFCNYPSNYVDYSYVCSVAMNQDTDFCIFPRDDVNHHTCWETTFEVEIAGVYDRMWKIDWIAYQSNAYHSSWNHRIHFDFSSYTYAEKQALIGVYEARRTKGEVYDLFKIALCYYEEPTDYRVPQATDDGTDNFEYDVNLSRNPSQTIEYYHEFNHYSLSTQHPECGTYDYDLTNMPSFMTWQKETDPSIPHKMTITIDDSTPYGDHNICYVVQSEELNQYEIENCFNILVRDCIQILNENGVNWVSQTGENSIGSGHAFEQDYTTTDAKYWINPWSWECDTICGCIDYTISVVFTVANPTIDLTAADTDNYVYKQAAGNNKNIFVNMVAGLDGASYDTQGEFLTTISITVYATNVHGASYDQTFVVDVYDCASEDPAHVLPDDTTVLLAFKGETVSNTLSSDSWTSDARCHPLRVSFEYKALGDTNWIVYDDSVPPSWVNDFSQNDVSDPFSYSVDLMLDSDPFPTDETYYIRNYSMNKDDRVFYQATQWTVHFYDAAVLQVWDPAPASGIDDNRVFIFVQSQTLPLLVSAYTNYVSTNTNVQLYTHFIELDSANGYTVNTASYDKLQIQLDSAATPFIDDAQLKIIPNYTGAAPASSDARWIEDLTKDFEIQLYDCSMDFTTYASNLIMLTQPAGETSKLDNGKLRYQLGTGIDSGGGILTPWKLSVACPSQSLKAVCQDISMSLDVTSSTDHSPYFSFDFDLALGTSELSVDSTSALVSPFTAEVQFTIRNDFHDEVVPVEAQIEFFKCDAAYTSIDIGAANIAQQPTISDPTISESDFLWTWDDFTFDDSFCIVNKYSISCTPVCNALQENCSDPKFDMMIIDEDSAVIQGASSKCSGFTFNTDWQTRSIGMQTSILSNDYSGEYSLEIMGWNELSLDNVGTMAITFAVSADCSQATVACPFVPFANDYQLMTDHIGLKIFEDKDYQLTEDFVLDAYFGCHMEFDLCYGALCQDDPSFPSYIELLDADLDSSKAALTAQPLTIRIQGTTHEHFNALTPDKQSVEPYTFMIKVSVMNDGGDEYTPPDPEYDFDVYLFPACDSTNVGFATIENIPEVEVNTQAVPIPVPFADLGGYDQIVCLETDLDSVEYVFVQKYYPYGQHNTVAFTMNAAQTQVTANVVPNYWIQAYDYDDSVVTCNLSEIGKAFCVIEYEIQARSFNSTIATFATGSVKFWSECLHLYTQDDVEYTESEAGKNGIWIWDPSEKAIFEEGYALRVLPYVSFELPRFKPKLRALDGTFYDYYDNGIVGTDCGDFVYSLAAYREGETAESTDVLEVVVPTSFDLSEAPSAQINLDPSANDIVETVFKGYYGEPYTQGYTFKLSVFLSLTDDAGNEYGQGYDYYADHSTIPYEIARQEDVTFEVRDYCLGVSYSDVTIVIEDEDTVLGYDDDSANLQIAKTVLSPTTVFYMTYPTYSQAITGDQDGCGLQGHEMVFNVAQPAEEEFQDIISYSDLDHLWKMEDGLRFKIDPLTDQNEGEFEIVVTVQVAEPWQAPSADFTIQFQINPCIVVDIIQGNQPFNYKYVIQNKEWNFTFQEFEQIPACNLTLSYTYTSAPYQEGANSRLQNQKVFDQLEEGQLVASFVQIFDEEEKSLRVISKDGINIDKKFSLFINAHLDIESSWQQMITCLSDPFYVMFQLATDTEFVPANQKPIFVPDQTKTVNIEIGPSGSTHAKTITVGSTIDLDGDPYTREWEIMSSNADYIEESFVEGTGSENLIMEVNPPLEEVDRVIKFKLTLKDYYFDESAYREQPTGLYASYEIPSSWTVRSEQTGYFRIEIKEYKAPEEEDTVKKYKNAVCLPVDITTTPVEDFKFSVNFSEAFNWPANITDWNSVSTFNDYFVFEYTPSKDAEEKLFDAALEQSLFWKVTATTPEKISFELKLSQEEYFDNDDKLTFQFSPKFGFAVRQKCSNETDLFFKTYDPGDEEYEQYKEYQSYIEKEYEEYERAIENGSSTVQSFPLTLEDENPNAAALEAVEEASTAAVAAVGGMSVVGSLFLSQVIQHLWAIINSLQMVVLTVLFSNPNMPEDECRKVLNELMKQINLDMIEAEPVLEHIFGEFKQTTPYSKDFADLGYDTSNFFLECGPLMFIILIFIVYAPIRKILHLIARKCNSNNACCRRLSKSTTFRMSMIRFLIESAIELSLSAYICIYKISEENFSEFWFGTSTVLAFVTLAIQIILPLYLIRAKIRYFRDVQAGVKESWYKDLFSDLQPKNCSGLHYSSIFLLRRFAMVSLIMNFPSNYNAQNFCHILLSLAQLCFVVRTQPFESQARNRQETVNEVAVTLSGYILLFFTEYCAEEALQRRMGFLLLAVIAITVAFNLIFVTTVIVRSIKEKCRAKRAKKKAKQQMNQIEESRAKRLEQEAAARAEVAAQKFEQSSVPLENRASIGSLRKAKNLAAKMQTRSTLQKSVLPLSQEKDKNSLQIPVKKKTGKRNKSKGAAQVPDKAPNNPKSENLEISLEDVDSPQVKKFILTPYQPIDYTASNQQFRENQARISQNIKEVNRILAQPTPPSATAVSQNFGKSPYLIQSSPSGGLNSQQSGTHDLMTLPKKQNKRENSQNSGALRRPLNLANIAKTDLAYKFGGSSRNLAFDQNRTSYAQPYQPIEMSPFSLNPQAQSSSYREDSQSQLSNGGLDQNSSSNTVSNLNVPIEKPLNRRHNSQQLPPPNQHEEGQEPGTLQQPLQRNQPFKLTPFDPQKNNLMIDKNAFMLNLEKQRSDQRKARQSLL